MSILSEIRGREDILRLDRRQQDELCGEIRKFLIQSVSDSGGHLASNLGIVEATVAVHKVFDTAKDRLVFDVGHQSYVHKILTGRMEDFSTLRQFGGLCGFPRPEESCHDAFIAGHASNAVSVALGMARARTRQGKEHHIIALFGDGALTGGLAYEGLNDLGASGEKVILILNNNGMSITRNVGGISKHLALLRLKPGYFGLKKAYRKFTSSFPGGRHLYKLTHMIKAFLKRSLIGTTIFEEMGLNYLGPVDGHDVDKITYLLNVAKEMDGPTLVHIATQKGRGYEPAENAPQDYHGIGKNKAEQPAAPEGETFSHVFGDTLCKLAESDDRICAVTAAMKQGTGLSRFAEKYPERFFDVGIAEGHAVAMAAGAAAGGMIPVVALYSTFLQRAFDMMLHDVALMQNHVIFAVDRAGLVGEDGPTHHGVFDVGYLRQVPHLTVYSPATAADLRLALEAAIHQHTGPVAIRYPRGACVDESSLAPYLAPVSGAHVTIAAYGAMTVQAAAAAALLKTHGITAEVVSVCCLKPLDIYPILESARRTGCTVVVEDTSRFGSVGETLRGLLPGRISLINLGDDFVPHGAIRQLYEFTGLDGASICRHVLEVLSHEN